MKTSTATLWEILTMQIGKSLQNVHHCFTSRKAAKIRHLKAWRNPSDNKYVNGKTSKYQNTTNEKVPHTCKTQN